MTTETKTTDFYTVRDALMYPIHANSNSHLRGSVTEALSRIEASHAALVAQRDALLTAMEAILAYEELPENHGALSGDLTTQAEG